MNERSDSSKPIPFAYPFMGTEEENAVLRVLRSGWLTTGYETLEFEKEFVAFLSDPPSDRGELKALAVNSATSGLHLALEACGVGPGDLVLTSPYTFTATAEVVRYLGAEVVFVDVAPDSFNIDPIKLESTLVRLEKGLPAYPPRKDDNGKESGKDRKIARGITGEGLRPNGMAVTSPDGFGPRGKAVAVIPVHFGGLPCDMGAILSIAKRFGLKVVEDAAHSFPSWQPKDACYAGCYGDVGVFSFYATKTITTGEGGMVVTRNPEIATRIAIMRSHGINRAVWDRYTAKKAAWRYAVVEAGFKYNLPDILAAIGREQLKRARDLLRMRGELAAIYDSAFAENAYFRIPPTSEGDARHLYPLRLALASAANYGYRDRFIEALQERGIGVSVHFIPLHTMPYYADRHGLLDGDMGEALDRFSAEISLPLWPGMTRAQAGRVTTACLEIAHEFSTEPGEPG